MKSASCGSLFVSPNTLSHSILLKTKNSKRYKFWIGENLWFKPFGKEKKLWQGQKAVLRLFMKIFWPILADCYRKSAFWIISTSFISHKEWDNGKEKERWESLISAFNIGRKWTSCTSVVSLLAYIADIQQRLIIRRQVSIFDTYIITYSESDKVDVHITITKIDIEKFKHSTPSIC